MLPIPSYPEQPGLWCRDIWLPYADLWVRPPGSRRHWLETLIGLYGGLHCTSLYVVYVYKVGNIFRAILAIIGGAELMLTVVEWLCRLSWFVSSTAADPCLF